jgi:hypothetical protein
MDDRIWSSPPAIKAQKKNKLDKDAKKDAKKA